MKTESQEKRILKRLQKKQCVTRLDGTNGTFKPYILNVPARINSLRDAGHDIFGKMLPEIGKDPKYIVYYMEGSMWFQRYGAVYK